jgi:hypothetical protein
MLENLTESSRGRSRGAYQGDTKGSLMDWVPHSDEIDDACTAGQLYRITHIS